MATIDRTEVMVIGTVDVEMIVVYVFQLVPFQIGRASELAGVVRIEREVIVA